MSRNLRMCLEKLKVISQIKSPQLRKRVLYELSDDCLYRALHEIAVNTVANKVKLNQKQKVALRRYKASIQQLSKRTNSKTLRRKQVVQSGGFLPVLLPAIASVLSSILAR